MDKKSYIGVIVVCCLLVVFIIARNNNQDDLKKNGILVSARITRVYFGGKSSGGFKCVFEYEGKEMELSSRSTIKRGVHDFVGKTFPGKYSPNTNTLEILIAPDDFEKFSIPFPDSLQWVTRYLIGR